jgi:hypothetical protein
MTKEEELHVRDVLAFFFRDDPPPVTITQELGTLAAQMLDAALTQSHAIDLLPRPPGFVPGVGWLVSQAVQIAWRQSGKQRIYEMVRLSVARNYKRHYQLAVEGL